MARRTGAVARKHLPKKPGLEGDLAVLHRSFGGRLAPPLGGRAYRFTIWLPVQSHGKPVFTEEHQFHLFRLFHECFGGFSQTSLEGFPPWAGSWLPDATSEAVIDHHMLLVIYALQDAESVRCMRQLKWILQQRHIADQEVVLIEQVPVHLIDALSPTA